MSASMDDFDMHYDEKNTDLDDDDQYEDIIDEEENRHKRKKQREIDVAGANEIRRAQEQDLYNNYSSSNSSSSSSNWNTIATDVFIAHNGPPINNIPDLRAVIRKLLPKYSLESICTQFWKVKESHWLSLVSNNDTRTVDLSLIRSYSPAYVLWESNHQDFTVCCGKQYRLTDGGEPGDWKRTVTKEVSHNCMTFRDFYNSNLVQTNDVCQLCPLDGTAFYLQKNCSLIPDNKMQDILAHIPTHVVLTQLMKTYKEHDNLKTTIKPNNKRSTLNSQVDNGSPEIILNRCKEWEWKERILFYQMVGVFYYVSEIMRIGIYQNKNFENASNYADWYKPIWEQFDHFFVLLSRTRGWNEERLNYNAFGIITQPCSVHKGVIGTCIKENPYRMHEFKSCGICPKVYAKPKKQLAEPGAPKPIIYDSDPDSDDNGHSFNKQRKIKHWTPKY
jgi:hypothetical protein